MTADQIIGHCRELIAQPLSTVAERWKAEHPAGRIVALYPVWAPAEIIHAAGMLPLSLLGGGTSVELTHVVGRLGLERRPIPLVRAGHHRQHQGRVPDLGGGPACPRRSTPFLQSHRCCRKAKASIVMSAWR